MLTSTLDGVEFAPDYPDLIGRRVLVTGIAGSIGVEVARLFAEQQTRLVLQAPIEGPESQAIAEIVAQSAMDVRFYSGPMASHDEIVRFARAAVQCFGGLDAVVNIAHVPETCGSGERDVEDAVANTLALPCLITKVAANRMRTTLTDGTILNIVALPGKASSRTRAVGGVARAALAAMTRREAAEWSENGIRVNAIAPATGLVPAGASTMCVSGAPDVATLALHLASTRGAKLSGLMFEAVC